MCEELFGGELDVVEVPDDCEKSQARQHCNWLHQLNEKDWCSLQKVMDTLKRMENFCWTKKKRFLPIREGLTVALWEMQLLKESMKRNDCYIEHFKCHLRDKMAQKIKEVRSPKKVVLDEGTQTLRKPAPRTTLDPRERLRELTVSPEVRVAKKSVEKRPRTSKQPEDWVEVPARRDLRKKKKLKPLPKKPERPKRARSEAVIIKPAEGVSYAAILKNLKSCVNPEELGVRIGRICETRTKGLLIEMKCTAENRGRLDSAFRDAVGESGLVRHLVPTVEVEILNVDPTLEKEEVAEAVRSYLREEPYSEVEISLTRTPFRGSRKSFRGTRKAFVRLEEARALTLLKATHIKNGWVSCRVGKKTEISRSYSCLGFGHMAANCQGPDTGRRYYLIDSPVPIVVQYGLAPFRHAFN